MFGSVIFFVVGNFLSEFFFPDVRQKTFLSVFTHRVFTVSQLCLRL